MARKALLVLLCLAVAGSIAIYAQQTLGGITGTVTDSSGLVVPAVTVTVMNVDTNLQVKTTSRTQGD